MSSWSPPHQYFEEAPVPPPVSKATNLGQEEEVNNSVIHPSGDLCKDIVIVQATGLTVDDENETAPEKNPASNLRLELNPKTGLNEGQSWG